MAPKININQAKATAIVDYLQSTGVAHSIKDLEKALPSITSINGMHVKDYLASLVDEGSIRVEKIGSGNWYWSFAEGARRQQEAQLNKAEEEKRKSEDAVEGLHIKVEELKRVDVNVDDNEKDSLMQMATELEVNVVALEKELETYRGYDTEVQKKEITMSRERAEMWTEQVMEMEKWMGKMIDKEQLMEMKKEIYGVDFDDEDEGLKDFD